MKSVRPALAVTVGALSTILLPLSIVGLILGAVESGGYSWWGFGGCVALAVASIFGMIGGFGRIRWALIMCGILSLVGAGFAIATCALLWQATQVPGFSLNGLQIAQSVFMFISALVGIVTGCVSFAAASARRRDTDSRAQGPAYIVEEHAKANIIRANRAVAAFSIMAMIFGIVSLIIAAVEYSYSSWWVFGGSCGIVLASIFGIVAGFRARRGMHIVHAILMFTAVAFTLVGVGALFHGARLFASLTSFQQAVAAIGFIAATFGFLGALISAVTVFMYRRRLLPTTGQHAGIPTAATMAAPQVVVQHDQAAQGWQAPGLSPRVNAAPVEPARFNAQPAIIHGAPMAAH